ncbi:MAG: ATP-dependent zinc protease [Chloroflexi bacterium]|nr:ATP-dependent zinc protease [Chloroflexota bacterium]
MDAVPSHVGDETNEVLRSESGRFRSKHLPVIGWRERVALLDLEIPTIKAKVDTGAIVSALHAWNIRELERDGKPYVRFTVNPTRRRSTQRRVEAPLSGHRNITSSSGHKESRPTIRTSVTVGSQTFQMNLTLTRRTGMNFPMLLGREAIRGRFVVDSGRSYVSAAYLNLDPASG